MIPDSTMQLGLFEFAVERAEFCYIDRGLEPVTWDINVYGHCIDDDARSQFPTGLMLSAQGIPLTLSPADDYTGFTLHTPHAAYPDSGRPYFAVWIDGEYETWEIDLRFAERKGTRYLMRFEAVTSFATEDKHDRLRIFAWAECVPPRPAPKTDYATWLRPGLRGPG